MSDGAHSYNGSRNVLLSIAAEDIETRPASSKMPTEIRRLNIAGTFFEKIWVNVGFRGDLCHDEQHSVPIEKLKPLRVNMICKAVVRSNIYPIIFHQCCAAYTRKGKIELR